jgi:hypothetical protein
MLRKTTNLFLLIVLIPVLCFSQHTHEAVLQKVSTSGFYSVNINQELSSLLHPSLKDLRIVDKKGNYVPYIISRNSTSALEFKDFHVIDNSIKDSGRTHLVIEPGSINLNSMVLVIRNAAVSRTAMLSGSDNMKNWFTIAEDILLAPSASDKNDRYALNLSFPVSSYKYLRLVINNGKNDPLHIIEAGTISSKTGTPEAVYLNNPPSRLQQTDSSDGITYISVFQNKPYHVNRITLKLKGPPFFKRIIELNSGGSTAEFVVNSKKDFSFFIPTINKKELLLKIYNGDNPPLKVVSLETAQEEKKTVAYMEKDEQYRLLLNDPSSSSPDYDLAQFKDSIPQGISSVAVLSIVAAEKIEKSKGENSTYLWIIIALVLVALSYFTWNLTKEVSKK